MRAIVASRLCWNYRVLERRRNISGILLERALPEKAVFIIARI